MTTRPLYPRPNKLNIKYLILLSALTILFGLSTVLSGYAAPTKPASNFTEVNGQGQEGRLLAAEEATPTPVSTTTSLSSLLVNQSSGTEVFIEAGEIVVNKSIPDNEPAGITSTYMVTQEMKAIRVEVIFNIEYDSLADLQATITTPSGRQINLPAAQLEAAEINDGLFNFLISDYPEESPVGFWKLTVADVTRNNSQSQFVAWNLALWQEIHRVYLPTILKSPAYRYTPEGIMLLAANIIAPHPQGQIANQQVQITPPLPTPEPGQTPVPTTGPGTPTYTPTPKSTLTPTPTNTREPVLINNGDFEDGSSGWRTFSLKDYPVVFDNDSDELPEMPISAFSESQAVWLGGDDSELTYVETEVFIPFDLPYLTNAAYTYSDDPVCASELFSDFTVATQFTFANAGTLNNLQSDVGGLIIYENGTPQATFTVDLCAGNATNSWVLVVYNTFPFRGRTVTIRFQTVSDSQLTSGYFIDDVGLRGDFPTGTTPFGTIENVFIDLDPNTFSTAPPVPQTLVPDKSTDLIVPQFRFHKNR